MELAFEAELAAGADVTTSLDPALHRSIQEGFSGVARAAGVVLGLPDGEVRALFSTLPHDADSKLAAHHLATSRPSHAGSTFKPFTAVAGLAAGVMTPSSVHQCTGSMEAEGESFHCWGVHGDVDLKRGLAESDNIFFFKVALALEHDQLATVQRAFGLGQPVPLFPHAPIGQVPSSEHYRTGGAALQVGNTLSQAIGHGEVAVTPLQIARAYAALATGVVPELTLRADQPKAGVPLDRTWEPHLAVVRDALRDTIAEPHGTAHFDGLPLDVAGKTGTATLTDSSGEESAKIGWFAGWAPAKNPRMAFAFAVEGNTGRETAKRVLAAMAANPWQQQACPTD